MTEYTAQATKATEQYFTALAKVQDDTVQAVKTVVAELAKYAPKTPAGFDLPKIDLPAVDLPTPTEVTAVTFDFTEKLVNRQRAFTEQLIAALTPQA